MEQHRTALTSSGFCQKAAKWLFIIALIAGVAAFTWAATAHPSIVASSCRSAAEALFPVVPYGQTYGNADAVSAVITPTTTMPQQPVTTKLFPEIKQEEEAVNSNAQPQEPHHNDDSHRKSLLRSSQCPLGGSRVDATKWALEDSLLRAAELQSDLASVHEENQQLSAHLLQAARQLAAVGQPVQLPETQQTELVQGLSSSSTAVLGMLLLMLPWALWGLLIAARRTPVTAQQQATNADNAADEVCLSHCPCHKPTISFCKATTRRWSELASHS